MTDAEILQSRFDHYFLLEDIREVVRKNTPTRLMVVRKDKPRLIYDLASERWLSST